MQKVSRQLTAYTRHRTERLIRYDKLDIKSPQQFKHAPLARFDSLSCTRCVVGSLRGAWGMNIS